MSSPITIAVSAPLVGAHFRPPAKALLQALPAGAPLWLVPEPTNEHDANAVKVMVRIEAIPQDQQALLEQLAAPYGFLLDDILSREEWQLGYVKRDYAAMIAPKLSGRPCPATLGFTLDGSPTIEAHIPTRQE